MINLKQLRRRCRMGFSEFEGIVVLGESNKQPRQYRFIDRGAAILAVAHLDHVSRNPDFSVARIAGADYVLNGALDDRLGAYLLLDLLPELGIKGFDVLLTDGEEAGQSSAEVFSPPRKYRWIFEFDRRGRDVATYVYGTPEWDVALKAYGWTPVYGTTSDISYLDDLGHMAFNFGAGYVDEHQELCRAAIPDIEFTVDAFGKFWADHSTRTYTYDPEKPRHQYAQYAQWDRGTPYFFPQTVGTVGPTAEAIGDIIVEACENCGMVEELDPDLYLCKRCSKSYEGLGAQPTHYKFTLSKRELRTIRKALGWGLPDNEDVPLPF